MSEDPDTICAGMGCKHPRKAHTEWGRCSTKRAFYNEVLYGYEQPLIYKTCMCPWMEPLPPARYKVRDAPQS